MNWILNRLAVGAFEDVERCQDYGITAVLTLCEAAPSPQPGILMSHAAIPDEVFLPAEVWAGLTTWLAHRLREGHSVLAHCRLGVSRSPTLCAAHLIQVGYAPPIALRRLVVRRPEVKPHQDTWQSMLAWWEQQGKKHVAR